MLLVSDSGIVTAGEAMDRIAAVCVEYRYVTLQLPRAHLVAAEPRGGVHAPAQIERAFRQKCIR